MEISRRTLLRTAGLTGATLFATPSGALARVLGGLDPADGPGASRRSRLTTGTLLVHADLHNHTLLSDGAGPAPAAFDSMRAAGLDVAALTDHSTLSQELPGSVCAPIEPFDEGHDCQSVAGINEASWSTLGDLADDADTPGEFTAIRGFEWSSPSLGHMNVWFSRDWADPLHTGGAGSPEDLLLLARENGLPDEGVAALESLIRESPAAGTGMRGWYEWLKADPSQTGIGGADGLIGFNHPGREPLRFSEFAHDPGLVERVVSIELFNRDDDYLFELTDDGRSSPLVACLDAGWRPGILGVTDEHGDDWGTHEDKGRAGLWVEELSRQGVRDALLARRFFATNVTGLRLDATANGVRMGSILPHTSGPVRIRLDLDKGPDWIGKELSLQVLRTGTPLPEVVHAEGITVRGDGEPVHEVTVDADVADGDWLVLRLSDPMGEADGRADDQFAAFGRGIAYASPWYLDPEG